MPRMGSFSTRKGLIPREGGHPMPSCAEVPDFMRSEVRLVCQACVQHSRQRNAQRTGNQHKPEHGWRGHTIMVSADRLNVLAF